jgi:antitoxin ParD1/3/4
VNASDRLPERMQGNGIQTPITRIVILGATKGAAMNVSLTPQLEQLVREKVESGRYNNASEVVREGLRLIEQRDQKLDWLRAEIKKGDDDFKAGRFIEIDDIDEFFDQVEREMEAEERQQSLHVQ